MKRWKSVVGAVLIAGSALGAMAGASPSSATALPPPAPLGTATLVGEAGNYVIGENSLSFTTITAMKLYSNGVRFLLQSPGHDLDLWFAPPTSQPALAIGVYDAAVGGISPGAPLLSISGDGRGCNVATGRFVVDSISLDADGIPLAFSAQYEFHCEGFAPAITGAINYTPPPPRVLPDPATPGTAQLFGEAGNWIVGEQVVNLTATQVQNPYNTLLRFELTSSTQNFTLSIAPPTGQPWAVGTYESARSYAPGHPNLDLSGEGRGCETYGRFVVDKVELYADGLPRAFDARFEAHCGTSLPAVVGAISYAPAPNRVLPAPTSAGTAVLNGDAGDYVLQGQSLSMTVVKNPFQYGDGSFMLTLTGAGQSYSLNLAPPPGQPWALGTYERAQRSIVRSPGRPGMDLYGEGRGCNTVSGRFVVDKLTLDATGVPLQLSVQFELHCEGLPRAVVGSINYGVPAHLISLSADSIDFGTVGKRSSGVQIVTVTNNGTSPGFVAKVGFTDRRQEDFKVTKNGCEEKVLKQGQSCNITIRFAPEKGAGTSAATLTLKDDQGLVHEVRLMGVATGKK
jgi:Abnormal spindle-like microcephaly-assoc'd, ASPM-SPD-2-Hydin